MTSTFQVLPPVIDALNLLDISQIWKLKNHERLKCKKLVLYAYFYRTYIKTFTTDKDSEYLYKTFRYARIYIVMN